MYYGTCKFVQTVILTCANFLQLVKYAFGMTNLTIQLNIL